MKQFKTLKVTVSLLCVLSLLLGSLLTFSLIGSAAKASPEVPTDLTNLTWSDFGMGGVYTVDSSSPQSAEQLDDVLIEGYVTLSGDVELRVPGIKSNYNWGGIIFGLSEDQLVIDGSVAISGLAAFIKPSDVGMTSFAGNEFLLQVSIQYVDNDADGAEDDLKLGIWVNGVAVSGNASMAADDGYVYVNDHSDYHVKGMMAYPRSGSVTLRDYKAFPAGLTEYGLTDMASHGAAHAITLGEPIKYTGGYYAYNADDPAAINDTIFNGDVSIPVADAGHYYSRWFDVKGTTGWYGLQMRLDGGGSLVFENGEGIKYDSAVNPNGWYMLSPVAFGLTTFINTQFNLKMALTNRAADGTSATLTVWINDYFAFEVRLVASTEHPIGSCMVPCANGIGTVSLNTYATSKPMPDDEQPDDGEEGGNDTPSNIPVGLTEITWADLGLVDGDYGSVTGHRFGQYALAANANDYASLNNTLFNGYVKFSDDGDLRWVGYDGWQGLLIWARADGYLEINNSTYGTAYSQLYVPSDFGLEGSTFIGQEFNLKISTQIDGDNFTFGVWINNVMAGDFFTLAKGGTPGSGMGIYDRGSGAVISIRSAEKTTFVSDLTELTWTDFTDLHDGAQPTNGGIYVAETVESMNNTIFNGDVTMPEGMQLRYAGSSENPWASMEFRVAGGQLFLCSDTGVFTNALHDPAKFGLTTFANTKFNLKIALTDMADDGSTVTVTVWVNNIAVSRSTFKNGTGYTGYTPRLIFNGAGAVVNDASLPITAPPVDDEPDEPTDLNAIPTPDATISWTDLGIAAGTYSSKTDGSYNTLNNVRFDGNVILNEGAVIRYGGSVGDFGLHVGVSGGMLVLSSDTFNLSKADGTQLVQFFTAADLGLSANTMAGTEFNLKVQMWNVADDVKSCSAAVWVNDVLLSDGVINMVENGQWGGKLGNIVSLYTPTITVPEKTTDDPDVPVVETLPTDYTYLYASDFGIANGTYEMSNSSYVGHTGSLNAALGMSTIDKAILHFEEISFAGANVHMNFFGPSQDEGFKLLVDGTEYLTLTSGWGHIVANNGYTSGIFLTDDVAGVDVVGGTYDLKVSIVYEGTVIKLGLWFNDVLYSNAYFLFDTVNKGNDNFGTWLAYRSDRTGTVTINSKRPEQEPDEPSGPVVDENIPTDLTNLGWYDFAPLANGTFPAIAGDLAARGTYDGSLDGTLLNGDIAMGAGTQFRYAGSDGWQGLIIEVTADDRLRINNSTFGTVYNELYPASTFGMDTLIGQKVNLKIALDIDDAGENYTFQVWINDIKAGDAFTLSKGGHIAGSMIGLYDNNSGNAITLSGAEEIVKETLPTDYTLLYPFDFGVQDGTYEMSGGLYDGHAGSIAGVNRIDKSILVFDEITFNGQVHMNFFGATNDLGWKLLADGDVLALTSGYGHVIANNGYSYIVLNDAIAGVDTVGGTYSLKISVIYEGDVATMGIWFNDVLYNDEYFVFDISAEKAGSDEFGAYLAFRSDTTGTVTIKTTSKEPDGPTPPPVITPSTPPQDLNKITFHSYGIADDVYAKNINGMYNGDIDGTIFSGYIKQSVLNHFRLGGTPDLNYGGGAGDWGGLIYRPNDATGGKTLVVEGSVAIPGWYIEVNASVFGMETLYDSEYFLQQSIEFVDNDNDGEKDDLKLGIWINGVMIAPHALNDTGCAADGYIYKNDVACNVGNLMMIYVADFGDNSTITVRSDENVEVVLPEAPEKDPNIPTDLTVLDWADFAPLTNATYPAIAGNLAGKGIYDGSLDGTLLDGDIAFGAGTEIRYAGNDGWQGVRLGISADDQLYISNSTFGTLYGVFYKPAAFGLETLIDTTVNLKIALDIDDSGENYTFQVWINDIKAGDAFTLAKGDCGVGSVIGLYDLDSGNAITLSGADVPEPVVLPKPTDPSKLAVISLKSFGIADTKLEVAKPVSGVMMYPVSYDGTVFKATLDLTTDASVGGTYIRFGGPDGGWNGLGLQTGVNGLLHLIEWHNSVTASSVVATLDPTVAGVDFYNGPFDVQISFEYVAADHDGVKNDVLVGVYFNGKAYNEDGFVVKDFEMANTLLMYVTENKDADGNPIKTQPMSVTGVQDVAFLPFDFGQFGFTENFKDTFKFAESEKVHGVPLGVTLAPFTGEPIEACFWIVVMAAAVAFGVLLIVKQVAKKAKK